MHERLSASTDLSPVRPEVARDNRGLGRTRAGMSREWLVTERCGSGGEGVDCDSRRLIPSTKARKLSSLGDGRIPLWGLIVGDAVGDEYEETAWGWGVGVGFMR